MSIYNPIAVYPAPPIFPIPKKCPKTVTHELSKSFGQFWFDSSACANSMRRTVEAIMDDLEVTFPPKDDPKKRVLHKRIEEFGKKNRNNQVVSDLLMGIKWLGNYGSHLAENLHSKSDLLDGFEILAVVIERLYDADSVQVEAMAKQITANKGKPAA